jgi:cytochrome c oxidase subunit 2
MTTNDTALRSMLGVFAGIAAVTVLALWLGHDAGQPRFIRDAAAAPVPAAPRDPVALGAQLYEQKGCVACHTVDGAPRVGPSFLHDFGTTIALADGSTVAMNEAYIRESVLEPQAKARPGYPRSMPSFRGLLKDHEIDALAAYIRSLR